MKKIFILTVLFFSLVSLSVPSVIAATPTLSDFWQGKAAWKPVVTLPEDGTSTGPWRTGFAAADQVVVDGSNWYLFNRHVDWGTKPDYCAQGKMTMEVRKSTDSGKTWTTPVDILTNTPGTPQECAATDGGAYYNASTNTWHIMYQCLADKNTDWTGCHATKAGADPLGPFTPDPANPVIVSDAVWRDICNLPTDKCVKEATGWAGHVLDAGTFDIFQFDGTYYWITFHGFDGVHGFRGMAKTTDFHTFIAGDAGQGLPTDAFLTPDDLTSWNVAWNGPPIGIGEGRTIKEGNYYYTIDGGADVSLGGGTGQHWGTGIFRSTSLSSNSWQQPTAFRNPVLINNPIIQAVDPAANPGYSGIFKDSSGKLYMNTGQGGYLPADSGIWLFSLYDPADVNEDGKVDVNDYNQLVADFGKTGSPANLLIVPFVPSDVNNDGKVDIFDYNILVGNFGK